MPVEHTSVRESVVALALIGNMRHSCVAAHLEGSDGTGLFIGCHLGLSSDKAVLILVLA